MELVKITFVFTVCVLSDLVLSDEECKARPVLLEVNDDPVGPKYVEVYQCHGRDRDSHKLADKCVSVEEDDISINVTYMMGVQTKTYSNHTKCEMRCACETFETNIKKCKPKRHSVDCYPGFRWNHTACKCQCDSPSTPTQTGHNTKGKNGGGNSVSLLVFVVSLLFEFAFILLISYCIFRKKRREGGGENPVFDRQGSTNSMQQFTNVIKRQCSRPRDGHMEGSISLLDKQNTEDGDSSSGSDITHMEINMSK